MERQLNEGELQDLYAWIDTIHLSRPKRNITRDFSDGVMAAEVVKYFLPKLVDLHNFTAASSTSQKLSNWNHLNRTVFSKLNFHVPEEIMKKIVLSTDGVIQPVLIVLKEKIEKKLDHTTNNLPVLELEYYEARNQAKASTAQQAGEQEEKIRLRDKKLEHLTELYIDMDPRCRLILQEKEHAVMALQETVEILKMKVDKLEHLVHLKNIRIDDLLKHLETYKTKENTHQAENP